MKKENSSPLSLDQIERLKNRASLPDKDIDTSDAPEVRDWTGARRGLFLSDVAPEDQVAVGLDPGIVDWFDSHTRPGESVDASINGVLAEHIRDKVKKAS